MEDSVIVRFRNNADKQEGRPAAYKLVNGAWRPYSWRQYWDGARGFAGALIGLGHEPGQAVTIIGNNCPEWVMADVGAMIARGVPAGIYQTSEPHQVEYIANHCEGIVCVVENPTIWKERVEPVAEQLTHVKKFVVIDGADQIDHDKVVSFDDFVASGADHLEAADERIEQMEEDDLATLIYTSGTTGPPKGVMLTQGNLAFTSAEAIKLIGGMTPGDCNVSYLPLSHIAEQMFTIHVPLSAGSPVYYCDDLKNIKEALVAARPTIFLGVPRVWEKFKVALEARLAEASGIKASIVSWSRGVGVKKGYEMLEKGGDGGFSYKMADKLFFSKIKTALGLDRLRVAVVGAAPIGLDVLEFFLSIGVPIHEVYGQSEDCGPTTFNRPVPGYTKLGTAGRPFPNIEVKIADDGEILVKGPNVFAGYYKNPAATAETLVNGWLHSGDIGEFDEDGFLRITDRKKDLIITAGGKNVAPQNIEKLLRKIDGISQAVVIGDRRKFLSALVTVDPERGPALAAEKGWPTDPNDLATHEGFHAHVEAGVEKANGELARYESIKKFTIIPKDFTVEGGELTPTQKVKRRVVNEYYADEIEAFYEGLS